MRVGLALPHYDFSFPDHRPATVPDVLSYAVRAESLGYDTVAVSDHLFLDLARYGGPATRFNTPEALTLAGAIAGATRRARVATLVLNVALRNPRVLALQAQTLDEASGGRLDLGIGAGWNEEEFVAAGIPFGSAADRIGRLVLTARTLGEEADGVAIWIGGKGGPKIMDTVAAAADGWNVVWKMDPDTYRARLAVLEEACDRRERDPATVRKSIGFYTLLGEDRADVARRFETWRAWSRGVLDGVELEDFAAGALVGTPEQVVARIKEFEALGVGEIVLCFAPVPFSVAEDDQIEIAARELLPAVR